MRAAFFFVYCVSVFVFTSINLQNFAKPIEKGLTISRYRDLILVKNRKVERPMPVISRFYGIIIRMYFLQKEHNPPHIHAIYNEDVAAIDFMTGEVIDGQLPTKAMAMVKEWISMHKDTLMEMWNTQEFKQIPPLE